MGQMSWVYPFRLCYIFWFSWCAVGPFPQAQIFAVATDFIFCEGVRPFLTSAISGISRTTCMTHMSRSHPQLFLQKSYNLGAIVDISGSIWYKCYNPIFHFFKNSYNLDVVNMLPDSEFMGEFIACVYFFTTFL